MSDAFAKDPSIPSCSYFPLYKQSSSRALLVVKRVGNKWAAFRTKINFIFTLPIPPPVSDQGDNKVTRQRIFLRDHSLFLPGEEFSGGL